MNEFLASYPKTASDEQICPWSMRNIPTPFHSDPVLSPHVQSLLAAQAPL